MVVQTARNLSLVGPNSHVTLFLCVEIKFIHYRRHYVHWLMIQISEKDIRMGHYKESDQVFDEIRQKYNFNER